MCEFEVYLQLILLWYCSIILRSSMHVLCTEWNTWGEACETKSITWPLDSFRFREKSEFCPFLIPHLQFSIQVGIGSNDMFILLLSCDFDQCLFGFPVFLLELVHHRWFLTLEKLIKMRITSAKRWQTSYESICLSLQSWMSANECILTGSLSPCLSIIWNKNEK